MQAIALILAIWDDWQDVVAISAVVLVSYTLVIWIAAVVWAYRDITARTTDRLEQAFSVLLVALLNVPGLLLHLLLRPRQTLDERYDRQLEAEAMLRDIREVETCARCRRPVGGDFLACPYCRAELRTACNGCGRSLAIDWVMCPFCTAERARPLPKRAAAGRSAVNGRQRRPLPAGQPALASRGPGRG